MRIFGVSVLSAYWHCTNRGYVDCNDVNIRCPLRIRPTCVSNHLGCTLPSMQLCSNLQAADCTFSSIYRIVQDVLYFWKQARHCVSHLLNVEHNRSRIGAILAFLVNNNDASTLIERIVTGDESWVHNYILWCEAGESKKKFSDWWEEWWQLVGRVMPTIFYDVPSVLLTDYQTLGTSVTKESYAQNSEGFRCGDSKKTAEIG